MEQKYSSGMRWLLYILSFLLSVPIGFIIGIYLMMQDDEESKSVGKNCLIAAILFIVFMCLCGLLATCGVGGLGVLIPSSALLLSLV